ncbi:hypothetical protein [Streptomyces sp. NBC_00624]|uniref:hypothetical protein n=1 Tax=Streptomyces sp. NBC_00624 TaxID=2975791 RepID=UPI0030DFDD6C
MRRNVGLAIPLAALALLTACGGSARDTHPCTLMGAPAGIRVEVHPELAHRVAVATLIACWDAACQEGTPQPTYLNGRNCSPGGHQARLTVTGEGSLIPR